jgi:hypothetical protein
MTRPRQVGTAAETQVVDYLRSHWPNAERRALHGNLDLGDITGIPGLCWEIKAGARVDLATWVDQTEQERVNAQAAYGLLVVRRRGARPGRWYTIQPLHQAVQIFVEAGW